MNELKLTETRKAIKKWKNLLGFSKWKIDVKITSFKRADNFLQDGDIKINYPKKKATILIGTILKSSVEEIVVHELVHLILWPLDQQVVSIIKQSPKQNKENLKNDFLGKLEVAVANITKTLIQY